MREIGMFTGKEPVKLLQKRLKDDDFIQSKPEQADSYNVTLEEGDVVISATDGLFDNLFTYEIKRIVEDCC